MIVKWFDGKSWGFEDGVEQIRVNKVVKEGTREPSTDGRPTVGEMITTLILLKNGVVKNEIEIPFDAYLLNDEGKTIERIN